MDVNSLSGRLKRHFDTSTSLAGFLSKLGNSPEETASELTKILGNLKGPLMKVAQILSIVPDMVPSEYAHHFQSLQSQAPGMGELFVKRRMKAELGINWLQNFSSFNLTPFSAASLGQVHKATDLEGYPLACKLQYPDMASTVEADLSQAKFFLRLYGGPLDTEEILKEVTDRLREELSYPRELASLTTFKEILAHRPEIHIPEGVPELSTERLLTMEYLEGQPLMSWIESPLEHRNLMAGNLFYAWYYPFYKAGLLHGDPHFGNYTFREDGSINLFDFGCVRSFTPSFVDGVLHLYQALKKDSENQMAEAYELWGFGNLTKDLRDALTLWAKFLYAPLLDNRVRPIDEDYSGIRGKEIARQVFQKLRESGTVKPPREFVFMDRAAVGLGSAFIRLRAELNWHELFEGIIQKTLSIKNLPNLLE
jgi:predicted unusual protein kinase regulating ubiquinone biosynthesis (AarF/ABC1/UbiB family)